jgi:hypothetical protein
MISFLKSLQDAFQSVVGEIPEGLRVILDFVWKARWFLTVGLVGIGVYTMVMKVLPYLMWSFIIKMVLGSFLSFLS